MASRAERKQEHRIQACKDVEIKPKFDKDGKLVTTWGDINKALRAKDSE